MPDTPFPDEWLATSLDALVSPERLAELRNRPDTSRTLWETLVADKVTTDEHILNALSDRFRLKLADLSEADLGVRGTVPEQVARRYRIVPMRLTDSFLEVATANPFDLDAEKSLAFATGREIRMVLASPSRIAE
jgi:type IV pilus assembly protein PilB